jgi:DNA-binding GntR family transcriptional regulator
MSPLEKYILVHHVYQIIKDMILSGELKPGEKLYQEKMAERLGVSRTPLVKAFQILEHEMLLESIPRRGMYVKSVNVNDLIDAFECRQGIETTAIRIIAERISDVQLEELKSLFRPFMNTKKINRKAYLKADSEFHRKLIQFSLNNYLIRIDQIVHVYGQTYKHGLIREPEETLTEHMMIISALETRDGGLAEEYMRSHIRKSVASIKLKLVQ